MSKEMNDSENDSLHVRIDESLRRQFAPGAVPDSHKELAERISGDSPPARKQEPAKPANELSRLLLFATAATLVIAASLYMAGRSLIPGRLNVPSFEQSSLKELYLASVDQGFTPYYDCSDPDRFRATFQHRQSVPLRLENLPDSQAMLGLSYPGGISRDTTAILFRMHGKPVIVYVDRKDIPYKADDSSEHEGLNVFQGTKGDLAFFEVTPLDEPYFLDYLKID
ncbi:MAG: hypothetical protein AAF483_29055 [Planctomycetota bacterium]